jgi:hypothetical protein
MLSGTSVRVTCDQSIQGIAAPHQRRMMGTDKLNPVEVI